MPLDYNSSPPGQFLFQQRAGVRPSVGLETNKENLSHMKKLLTLLFAVALTLSMSSFALAQDAGSSDKTMDKKSDKAEKKAAKKNKASKKDTTKKDDMKKDDMSKPQ